MPPALQSLFLFCGALYISIYTLEGVVRYGLSFAHADTAILARDLLIWLPLTALLVYQATRLRVERAYLIYAAVIAVHGSIIYLNFRNLAPVAYGAKVLVNVLFGYLAGTVFTHPGRRTLRLFALLWFVGLIGLALEKFFFDMPWVGMSATIGGITVDVSHNWDIVNPLEKRVAGFTRGSIPAATVFPILALLISVRVRSWFLRAFILLTTAGAVFATTQKGSFVAICVVSGLLLAPLRWRVTLLRFACVAFIALMVVLPTLTNGLMMTMTGGVFSMASFAMRIQETWPFAWDWILHNEVFPFGVGLGGIGGPQRFYAPDFFNPADNMFVFMYANFGVATALYLGALLWVVIRLPRRVPYEGQGALAVFAFMLGYGAVLTMIEDQVSALYFGACAATLWRLRSQRAVADDAERYRSVIIEPQFAERSPV